MMIPGSKGPKTDENLPAGEEKENMEKEKVILNLKIIIGTLIIAASIHFFLVPNHIVAGSITGLAMVLVKFIPIPVSAMTFILNMICLVIAFLFIGKEFGMKIIFISVLLPALMYVFEVLFPNTVSPTGDLALDAVCLVMTIALGQAILFQANAASGGLDIIAKVMNKYLHMDLGEALIISGMATVFSSLFAYDLQTVVIGGLVTYFCGVVLDGYIDSFARKKRVCILSDHYEQTQQFIMYDLNRGVTLYSAKGGYDGKERQELVVILTKKEYGRLMDYMEKEDPKAFVTISDVNRVVGSWNPANKSYF